MKRTQGSDEMFEEQFEALTTFRPLSWQSRLFSEHFARNELPATIDIPTGLGKTAVMALWLIARARRVEVPRRLVYVVDRRAVVDQATTFAETLRRNLDERAPQLKEPLGLEARSLPISTLRGQYVDNRTWLEDPTLPAVIIGTVDMIGSRLLFGGYGVSRKMRPYHAGLLGADTLVVLDEAHLVPSFERLIEAIERGSKEFGARDRCDGRIVPACKLLSLSATGRERVGNVFCLKGTFDAPAGERGDLDDKTVERRLKATKIATLVTQDAGKLEETKLEEALAGYAWQLAEQGNSPIRCIVFSNSREIAEKARRQIEILAKGNRKQGGASRQIDSEFFVGARRVRERQDVMAGWLKEQGFIAGNPVERSRPAFLFATSAGEVGVDLDADHVVCDLVAWERLVQRLGRVNRRGERDAKVLVVDSGVPQPKKKGAETREETAAIRQYEALRRLLNELPSVDENKSSVLVSPDALRVLKERARTDRELAETLKTASSPAPLRPALTRAVVDAWSMTSLEEHTGRPEVAPWLRGWVDEKPQTTVIWRRYLPVRKSAGSTTKEIEEFFEAAPPHVSEQLETETFIVTEWLGKRCEAMLSGERIEAEADREEESEEKSEEDNEPVSESSHDETVLPKQLSRRAPFAFVLSQSGELRETLYLEEFASLKEKDRSRALERKLRKLESAVIVVDARLGGIEHGLLDTDASAIAMTVDDGEGWMPSAPSVGRLNERSQPVVKFRVRSVIATDEEESDPDWRERYRLVIERNDDGADLRWLIVDKWHGDSTNEEDRSASNNPQLLSEHQSWAESRARMMGQKLGLPDDLVVVIAMAARLHDEGKKASRWQRAFRAPSGREPYAKTRGPINFALLDGYRHELGSLAWAEKDESFKALPEASKDLVLHLIAAHHGQARPVISTKSCEDAPPSALDERARQISLCFARLQKQWGPWGLAWLESLLRAADQQASRANDERIKEKSDG